MSAPYRKHCFRTSSSDPGSSGNYPTEPVRWYLELSRKTFWLDAARRDSSSRTRNGTENGPWQDRLDGQQTLPWSVHRPSLSEEDIRIHAWLSERLAKLHYERYGLWPGLRRFLFGYLLSASSWIELIHE